MLHAGMAECATHRGERRTNGKLLRVQAAYIWLYRFVQVFPHALTFPLVQVFQHGSAIQGVRSTEIKTYGTAGRPLKNEGF